MEEQKPKKSSIKSLVLSNQKQALIIGAAVVLTLAVGALLVNNRSKEDTADTSSPIAETVRDAEVSIGSQGFEPASLRIAPGTRVTWENNDEAQHQVASDPHPSHDAVPGLFDPEPMNRGDTFSFIFTAPGKYTYHDHLNPFEIKGEIVVE